MSVWLYEPLVSWVYSCERGSTRLGNQRVIPDLLSIWLRPIIGLAERIVAIFIFRIIFVWFWETFFLFLNWGLHLLFWIFDHLFLRYSLEGSRMIRFIWLLSNFSLDTLLLTANLKIALALITWPILILILFWIILLVHYDAGVVILVDCVRLRWWLPGVATAWAVLACPLFLLFSVRASYLGCNFHFRGLVSVSISSFWGWVRVFASPGLRFLFLVVRGWIFTWFTVGFHNYT